MSELPPGRAKLSLDELLAQVPRAIEPPEVTWSAVSRRIRAREQRHDRWPMALAAGIALASLAVLLGWHRFGGQIKLPSPSLIAKEAPEAPGAGSHAARLEQARTMLRAEFMRRLQPLAPATRARIEANLRIIRDADADIRRALIEDPASPVLLQLQADTSQQEIELYRNLVGNDAYPENGGQL